MSIASCQLCKTTDWLDFSSIIFGTWDEDSPNLSRHSSQYPLSQCQTCGHVQVSSLYTPELFENLYFHSTQEAVMWHETLINCNQAYCEMIDFALQDENVANVVDFGCGEGSLLAATHDRLPNSELFGIDFNDRFSQDCIKYLTFDLNNLNALPNRHWPEGIALAMASHVLEHVVDPVNFLKAIKQRLKPEGTIFIEVPDFSERHNQSAIGMSNLINLQHIHYFTADSLTFAAAQAGLKVVKQNRCTTGYIPRLQVTLKPLHSEVIKRPATQYDAADVITHYQHQCRKLRENLANLLKKTIEECGHVGIWGAGADFYNLVNEHPSISELINQGKITLFDYSLKSKRYGQQLIRCSSDIPSLAYSVFMSPLLAETRVKMHAISKEWHNVNDPFSRRC